MPRKPQVRYFSSRGAYYTQIRGKQYKLAVGPDDAPNGPTYIRALDTYRQLLTTDNIPTERDRSPVWAILETAMAVIEKSRSRGTTRIRTQSLKRFAEVLGERAVGSLTHADLDEFIAKMRELRPHGRNSQRKQKWGNGSVTMFLKSLNACLNWAVKRKLISQNPVRGYEVPTVRSRSVLCLVKPSDHLRILEACRTNPVRELIIALEASAARPGELINAEAKDWDERLGAIVYRGDDTRREDGFRHKNAGKCRDRVIRFHGESLEIMRGLLKRYPQGRLFRNRSGRPWTSMSLGNRFRKLRLKLGLTDFIPYSYRHTFATRWLECNGNIDLLAEIMGNSPVTIRRHYRHITPHSGSVDAAYHAFFAGK